MAESLPAARGLAVAKVYYAQPLLYKMARKFEIGQATIGFVLTRTQTGYGLVLLLVVRLGDLLNRRRAVSSTRF
jgi:predicted MFS family arabinose efflux permease